MLDVTRSLPEDPAELRAFTTLLLTEVKAQAIVIHCPATYACMCERAEAAPPVGPSGRMRSIRLLAMGQRAHRFGPSSKTAGQLQPALEMSQIAIAIMTAKLCRPQDAPADKPTCKPIPDHIPRLAVERTPGNAECTQCGSKLRRLGEDVTEELEYVPGPSPPSRALKTNRCPLPGNACPHA